MPVAIRKRGEQRRVELQCGGRIHEIETVLLVNRLPPDDGPFPVAPFEEVVETSPADDVDDDTVKRGALKDVHLHLRDGAGAVDVARPAVQRVEDVDAALESFFAHADELARGALKPCGRHPAIRMPDGGKTIPVARIAPDDPVLDALSNRSLIVHCQIRTM